MITLYSIFEHHISVEDDSILQINTFFMEKFSEYTIEMIVFKRGRAKQSMLYSLYVVAGTDPPQVAIS